MALPVKIASGFGVLEYWSFGVLEKTKPRIQFQLVLSLLHYSSMLPQENKTIETYSWGGSRPGFSSLDSCYGQHLWVKEAALFVCTGCFEGRGGGRSCLIF